MLDYYSTRDLMGRAGVPSACVATFSAVCVTAIVGRLQIWTKHHMISMPACVCVVYIRAVLPLFVLFAFPKPSPMVFDRPMELWHVVADVLAFWQRGATALLSY